MLVKKWTKGLVILFALLFLCTWAMQMEAWARAGSSSGGRSSSGGGGSIGSRGSRTGAAPTPYTAPKPTQPSQPSPGMRTPPPASQPSSFWRSFGGGMLGGMAGGLLFSSLFGGRSYGGGMGGGGGAGIGLFDILLLCGIGYLIYWYVKKRRLAAQAGAYQSSATGAAYQAQYPPVYDQPQESAASRDLEQGLANIRQFDPYFDEAKFQDMAMDLFFKTQGA
ncbi:MAG: hypothetical protein NTW80_05850, partial [Deltaproteobacteria bacterium]|nr:hypothetical protein [Deltaproteobacteria bacterium]